jgi:carbon monoxide dehydrogenase subunit G
MQLTGEVRVQAPADEVWRVFMTPDLLCRAVKGCEEIKRVDEHHYDARLAVKVQFMTVRARVAGELVAAREPEHLVVDLEGETAGITGAFKGRVTLDLGREGATTRGRYLVEGTILGPLGGMGEPILRSAAQKFATRFAEQLADVIRESKSRASR